MTFKDYLNEAWNQHADHADKIFKEFPNHFNLVQSDEDVVSLAHLITHVSADHLGQWTKGVELIDSLLKVRTIADESPLKRFKATLNICADKNFSLDGFSDSDRARILAACASALAARNETARADKYLKKAELIAKEKLKENDPAFRGLAITGNTLACTLEDKETRNSEEVELMKLAAHVGRTYWEKSGTWLNVERAEYRLANTYLKAGDPQTALKHAESCLKIITKNGDDPIELFYAHEALGMCAEALDDQDAVEKHIHQMETQFARMTTDDQSWTKPSLDKIKAL